MRASEVAAAVGGTLEGEDVDITACAGLEEARKGDLMIIITILFY